MKLLQATLLIALSVALADCSSVMDGKSRGFFVNTNQNSAKSHLTNATKLGYRLGIPL